MARMGGREWYLSIRPDKLCSRQYVLVHFKGTLSREEHKSGFSVFTSFCMTHNMLT